MTLLAALKLKKANSQLLSTVTNPNILRSNMIDGPYTPTRPTKADQVIFWLSGFVAGLIFALLITGN
jgi:hypothetical protein